MERKIVRWSIRTIRDKFTEINFPEYQREPNIWSLDAKQRLIDSIRREFDISSIYIFENENGTFECVDGRQRLNTIMSFLGENSLDHRHNSFVFRVLNELYEDSYKRVSALEGKRYQEIRDLADNCDFAKTFIDNFLEYNVSVVMLSESEEGNEFNLQFTRLNLGTIINSGERLNAMVGELRNVCFDDIGSHDFLQKVNMSNRRFAREQTAAQIIAQTFALEGGESSGDWVYARTRNLDIQKLFKEHNVLSDADKKAVDRVRGLFDLLSSMDLDFQILRGRAMIVSVFVLAYQLGEKLCNTSRLFAEFVNDLLVCLHWQLAKGHDFDRCYQHFIDFQRHLTQASVEKSAVEARAHALLSWFQFWLNKQALLGDTEYLDVEDENPSESRKLFRTENM